MIYIMDGTRFSPQKLTLFLTPFIMKLAYSLSTLPIDALNSINFVVTNVDGCSIALPQTSYEVDLYRSIVVRCDVSYQFEIQLSEETIVSALSFSNQTIAEIPRIISVANDLYQIWGQGFRIPLKLNALKVSPDDVAIYVSLTQMFGGSDCNVHEFDWFRFIKRCAKSGMCALQNLCDLFEKEFDCDHGELWSLNLNGLKGYINLAYLPSTVSVLLIDKNEFTGIGGLDRLAGKRLKLMDIRTNPLNLDLEPFIRSSPRSIGNPLKRLRISGHQIAFYFLGISQEEAREYKDGREQRAMQSRVQKALIPWFHSSVLEVLRLGHNRRQNNLIKSSIACDTYT